MQGLSNARHLVVKHTGHIASTGGCAPKLVAEFMDSKKPLELDASCLENNRATPFVLNAAGPAP